MTNPTLRKYSPSKTGAKKQLAMRANYNSGFQNLDAYSRLVNMLTVPRGATTEAGANAYEIKFPNSPTFMRRNPSHLT